MPPAHFRVDLLTGLPNEPWLASQVELLASDSASSLVALIVLDIDHLRYFNLLDSYTVVDNALKDVAAWLSHSILPGGPVARTHGGEFAMLHAVSSQEEATAFSHTLRLGLADLLKSHVTSEVQQGFDELAVANEQLQGRFLTACVGVVCFRCCDRNSFESLLSEARARVAAAKLAGRNRVWADPAPPADD